MLSIRINMEKGSLKDINNLTTDVSNWATGYGDYLIKIKNKHDLDYFMDLFETVYKEKIK